MVEMAVKRARQACRARERGAGTSPGGTGETGETGETGRNAAIAAIAAIAATGETGSIAMAGVIGGTGDADVAVGVPVGEGAAAISRWCPTRPLS